MSRNQKLALLFVVSLGSIAYLIEAAVKVGVWGGILFVIIWTAVFLRERHRIYTGRR